MSTTDRLSRGLVCYDLRNLAECVRLKVLHGLAVLRADGSVEFTPSGGLPLGAFAHIEPEQTDLCLNEGDMLLLYTDGVTEARDPSGRFYTDARLTEASLRGAGLSAAELVRSIELDVSVFTGDATAMTWRCSHCVSPGTRR
jgi:serine phosphatase RsbU (regulator of sigma subunit)